MNLNWLGDTRNHEVVIAAFKRVGAMFPAREVQPLLVNTQVFPGDQVIAGEQILQVITSSSSTYKTRGKVNFMPNLWIIYLPSRTVLSYPA